MRARPDRPAPEPDRRKAESPEPDRSGPGRREPRPADELRRRLDSLPASHPSSPWYRGRRQGETGPGQPRESGRVRSDKSVMDRTGQDGTGATAAAAAARVARPGKDRPAEKGRRGVDDALWARAASWHAAAQAKRERQAQRQAGRPNPRGPGIPGGAGSRREPFRPWFADGTGDDDLWLSADGTGEPWFTDPVDRER